MINVYVVFELDYGGVRVPIRVSFFRPHLPNSMLYDYEVCKFTLF